MHDKRAPAPRASWARVAIPLALLLAVVAVYCPWGVLTGRETLVGSDHQTLHARRMAFAHEALSGEHAELPAWYPRELMGAPFRANLQNFPLIPTRLLAFALFEPEAAFGASVVLSACLAAVFTYLLCRRLGLSRIASAAAGWTFACCGFFASRVLAGHLPLLEAFPALPTLLYAVERVVSRANEAPAQRWNGPLVALALASTCFALVGHPQLTIYALGAACVFAFARAPHAARAWRAIAALILGAGIAGFALVPMASLTQRSTRVLELNSAGNDLALPYERLAALWLPWRDGWPQAVQRAPANAFHGYRSDTYFWDTVSYSGWAPWLALVVLAAALITKRARLTRTGATFACGGLFALAFSLPWFRELMSELPGTFLRSPARLLFVVSFCLALALGAGLDRLHAVCAAQPRLPRWWGTAAIALVLALHGFDLSSHARAFLVTQTVERGGDTEFFAELRARVGDGRIGIDTDLITPHNRALDDIGFFDSLMLARPYRFVFETSGAPPGFNQQLTSGAQLAKRTLRACGVRFVWTTRERTDLEEVTRRGAQKLYEVPRPEPRADFVPSAQVRFVANDELHRSLADATYRLDSEVLIDASWKDALGSTAAGAKVTAQVRYERPGSDLIVVEVACGESGLVRVLETWDPGWSATVDGEPARVVPAHDTFLAVPLAPGEHVVRFEYRTPGAWGGIWTSLASLVVLLALSLRWR